jgi:predicted anti-sigma-YlaC factor YlaD
MDCKTFTNNILRLRDEELNLEEERNAEDHIQGCVKCRNLYNEVSRTYNLIAVEKQLSVNPFFYHSLKTKLENKQETRTIRLMLNLLKPIAVAASIGFGILIGNGEQNLLLTQDNDFELVSESLSPTLSIDYSIWTTLNDEYGSEN